MLLQALFEFAKNTKAPHGRPLLDSLEFDSRYVAWLIDIKSDGSFNGFIPLMSDDEPGTFFRQLPRTLEPKDSGTVAEFLVEDVATIFGLGESPATAMKDKARLKHDNFWTFIDLAARELNHSGLRALLSWKDRSLGRSSLANPVYELYQKPGGRAVPKQQWLVITTTGAKRPLHFRPNTTIDGTFRVDGELLVTDEAILHWWSAWFAKWVAEREKACRAARGGGRVCLLTGERNAAISNSHLPKIKGSIFQSFGATLASSEAESFHSYGLAEQQVEIPRTRKGPDASYSNVSVRGAMAYCSALNHLLAHEDHHLGLGPLTVCFWTNHVASAARQFNLLLGRPDPKEVEKFLKAPFAGDPDRQLLYQDRLYTVALAGDARVVVLHWLNQTLEQAIEHFRRWWDELRIVAMYDGQAGAKKGRDKKTVASPPPAYAIPTLARVTLRRSKNQKDDKLVAERIVALYRAALEGTAPSLSLLKPILDEFHSALVKNDESDAKKRSYPFSRSRFAVIKLILIRNRKEGDFMPEPKLADTPDAAYNLGRLLAVFEGLQDKYHDYDKKGAGVVERYYGTASSAPAAAFPILCRLARHHLSKVRKEDESAAYRIEQRITGILQKFQPEGDGKPPLFKRVLTLEEQGRFALGFYQQKAYDAAAASIFSLLAQTRDKKAMPDEARELIAQARQTADKHGYADLVEAVTNFKLDPQ